MHYKLIMKLNFYYGLYKLINILIIFFLLLSLIFFFRNFSTFEVFLNKNLNVNFFASASLNPYFIGFCLTFSFQRFLRLPLLYLPSGCQFFSDLGNLLFYILITLSNNLKLFLSIFLMIFVLKFNSFPIQYLSFFPISFIWPI